MDKKIGNRVASIVYHCTGCEGSFLNEKAFEKHNCSDYRKLES